MKIRSLGGIVHPLNNYISTTPASQKALGYQNLTRNGRVMGKYVAAIGNPEKIQNFVKKRHNQTKA